MSTRMRAQMFVGTCARMPVVVSKSVSLHMPVTHGREARHQVQLRRRESKKTKTEIGALHERVLGCLEEHGDADDGEDAAEHHHARLPAQALVPRHCAAHHLEHSLASRRFAHTPAGL